MASRITRWDGDALVRAVRTHMKGNLDDAGKAQVREYQQLLSHAYPPASSPGEAPHKRSGHGSGGVRHVTRDMGVDIVCDVDYMHILDAGGSRVEARPWKQAGFDQARDEMRRILSRPM